MAKLKKGDLVIETTLPREIVTLKAQGYREQVNLTKGNKTVETYDPKEIAELKKDGYTVPKVKAPEPDAKTTDTNPTAEALAEVESTPAASKPAAKK